MAFSRVIVAVDGSDQSRAAVDLAFALTAGHGAHLTLVHVVEVPLVYRLAPDLVKESERPAELEQGWWRERLAGLAANAPEGTTADVEVKVDERPARALLDLVDDVRADLLVAGAQGAGGAAAVLLGSVSQKLLERAPCSVLVVRDDPSRRRRTGRGSVVAGIDGSDATAGVLAVAQSAAVALSADLVLAHVVEPLRPLGVAPEYDVVREFALEQGRRVLHDAGERVTAPLDVVREELREGRARDELADLCESLDALLAVVGSEGAQGIAGLLLGSTARHLANAAPCPVLAVRGYEDRSVSPG